MLRFHVAALRASRAALVFGAALLPSCGGGGGPAGPTPTPQPSPPLDPRLLSSSGLYSDLASKRVDPKNRPYSPQYALWSDGGVKRRWLFLPAGTRIDTSDMDHWVFPVGTKIWKEFVYEGRRVETRLIEKVSSGAALESWRFRAYAWRSDEGDAELVGAEGRRDVAPTAFGTLHDIPAENECMDCHDRGGDAVLGVDALQLSADRDPLAVEAVPDGGINLEDLAGEGLVTHAPTREPRIAASSGTARWAMGYLHGNCGNCHNPQSAERTIGLFLRHETAVESERDEPAYSTAVNQLTRVWVVPGTRFRVDSYRIRGGSHDKSAVYLRAETRGAESMPPFGSEVVDAEALGLLRDWIKRLPRP